MKRNKIIYQPSKLKKYRRNFELLLKFITSSLTTIATITLWILFAQYIWKTLFYGQAFEDTSIMFKILVGTALAAFFSMFVWEQYNIRLFGKKNRRNFHPPVLDKTISKIYSIDEQKIISIKQAKSLWLEENPEQTYSSWYTDKGDQIKSGTVASRDHTAGK